MTKARYWSDAANQSTLYVDSTNNRVGIANASPSVELDVTGAAKVSGDLTVDTNTLYVDSTNNNVGVGTTSPQNLVQIEGSSGTVPSQLRLGVTSGGQYYDIGRDYTDGLMAFYGGQASPYTGYKWSVNAGTEAMRIDSSGNLLVGATSYPSYGIINASSSTSKDGIQVHAGSTSATSQMAFRNPNGYVGTIVSSGSSTSYNTSSDYRLKENVTGITGATERLKQLNPVRFNFIADADTTVDGFLAHEVQTVVPEAISGTHNEVDDDGNPVYQGIDQSKLVPLLVKTIQELEARITALETA